MFADEARPTVLAQFAINHDLTPLREIDFAAALAGSIHSEMVDGIFLLIRELLRVIEYTEEQQTVGDPLYEAAAALRRYYYEVIPHADRLSALSVRLLSYTWEQQLNLLIDLMKHLTCCTRMDVRFQRVCFLSPAQYNAELQRVPLAAEQNNGFLHYLQW